MMFGFPLGQLPLWTDIQLIYNPNTEVGFHLRLLWSCQFPKIILHSTESTGHDHLHLLSIVHGEKWSFHIATGASSEITLRDPFHIWRVSISWRVT